MSICLDNEKIKEIITNENYHDYHDRHLPKKINIENHQIYSHPYRKYNYDIHLKNLEYNIYIMNGKPVTGSFENITFLKDTFFDCSIFRRVIFKDCHFGGFDIRWCKFENCQFINCTGKFYCVRATTFKKDCVFENSSIEIGYVDQYMWFNSKRYNGYEDKIILQ